MSKITPSVYKIDLGKLQDYVTAKQLLEELDENATAEQEQTPVSVLSSNAHTVIKRIHDLKREEGLSDAKAFSLLPNGLQNVENRQVAIYGTTSNSKRHEWGSLFPEPVGDLMVQRQNLAAFMTFDNECYAISAGNGYTLFEQFIDTSFPLEIAKRIMNPELDATTERAITGALYGRMQQFRTAQMIASSQNLGTIWQVIKGKINDSTLVSENFQSLFETDKSRVNLEAGSSIKIKSSMSINKLLDFIVWLISILEEDPTPEQVEAFRFLDSLREVPVRKDASLIEQLYVKLCSDILSHLPTGQFSLDFSHKHFDRFQGADSYEFQKAALNVDGFPSEVPPSADDILNHLHGGGFLESDNASDLKEELEKIVFCAVHSDETNTTKGSVLSHLHGEVFYNNQSYFLVDGKWYIAEAEFIQRVESDFDDLLESDFFEKPDALELLPYDLVLSEGDYNESYISSANWLTADRVFMSNVELADVIGWNEDKVFVVHNKVGFGVTVRDVCSQILHSMHILNQARIANDVEMLESYYDRIASKYYGGVTMPITKEQFVEKLMRTASSDIIYILGYADNEPVDTTSRSNIAKFEAVKLCRSDKRAFDFGLKIVYLDPA